MRGLLALALFGASASVSPAFAAPIYLSCNFEQDGELYPHEITVNPDGEFGVVNRTFAGSQLKVSQFIGPSAYVLTHRKYIGSGDAYLETTYSIDRTDGTFVRRLWAPSLDEERINSGSCSKAAPKNVLF